MKIPEECVLDVHTDTVYTTHTCTHQEASGRVDSEEECAGSAEGQHPPLHECLCLWSTSALPTCVSCAHQAVFPSNACLLRVVAFHLYRLTSPREPLKCIIIMQNSWHSESYCGETKHLFHWGAASIL